MLNRCQQIFIVHNQAIYASEVKENMSKQYNKMEKRKRRHAYLKRRAKAVKAKAAPAAGQEAATVEATA